MYHLQQEDENGYENLYHASQVFVDLMVSTPAE